MKVGDYVRTKCGIAKIKSFEVKTKEVINLDKDIMFINQDVYRNCCTSHQVLKSRPNIIDLIEENDLIKYRINGDLYVSEVEGVPIFDKYKLCISYADTIKFLEELDIVSIVTKEQFESMEYRIGE